MRRGLEGRSWFGQFVALAVCVFAAAFLFLGTSRALLWRYQERLAAGEIALPQPQGLAVPVLGVAIGGGLPSGLAAAIGGSGAQAPLLLRRPGNAQTTFVPVARLSQAFALCARLAGLPQSCTPAVVSSRELFRPDGMPISREGLQGQGVAPYAPPAMPKRLTQYVPATPPARSTLHWLSDRYRPGDARLTDIVAVGDVMMGSIGVGLNPQLRPGVDAASLVGAGIADNFRRADVAFANLEGPLYDGPGGSAKDCARCFSFHSPAYYAGVLASLGVTVVSLANNHSGDYGEAGRDSTMAALARRHIGFGGLDRDGARVAELRLRDGRTLAFTAFAPNSGTLPLNDRQAAVSLIARLKKSHDLVMVSFHGGAEGWDRVHVPGTEEYFLGEDRGNVEAFAHAAIDAGADIVIGQGPHVPRAVEIYRGHLIAYSLGNFWTYDGVNSYAVSGLGPMLEAWLEPDGRVAGVDIHSTRQAGLGVPHADPLDEADRYILYLTRSDFPGTAERLEAGTRPALVARREEGGPAVPFDGSGS